MTGMIIGEIILTIIAAASVVTLIFVHREDEKLQKERLALIKQQNDVLWKLYKLKTDK